MTELTLIIPAKKEAESLPIFLKELENLNYKKMIVLQKEDHETKNSLKFEYEMKGKVLQQYHLLLVENRLEEFEQKLSSQFLIFFGKLLPLQFSYLDWLVLKLRHIRKQTFLQSALDSDYIKSQILMDTRSFIMLLQFLTYAQHLDFEIESLGGIPYRQVTFKVRDFLEFQNKLNVL